jgi:F-type H+-transporting ATPase subunit alpha
LAQYRELAAFAQFGSDLDKATQAQLNRGARLVELLKQGQFEPLPFTHQVLSIFAGTNGFLDDLTIEEVRPFEKALYAYIETVNPALFKNLAEKKSLTDEIKADISKTTAEAKERFLADRKSAAKIETKPESKPEPKPEPKPAVAAVH